MCIEYIKSLDRYDLYNGSHQLMLNGMGACGFTLISSSVSAIAFEILGYSKAAAVCLNICFAVEPIAKVCVVGTLVLSLVGLFYSQVFPQPAS